MVSNSSLKADPCKCAQTETSQLQLLHISIQKGHSSFKNSVLMPQGAQEELANSKKIVWNRSCVGNCEGYTKSCNKSCVGNCEGLVALVVAASRSSFAAPSVTSPSQFPTQLLLQDFAYPLQFPTQLLFQTIYFLVCQLFQGSLCLCGTNSASQR